MTFVGVLGILAAMAAYAFAGRSRQSRIPPLVLALLILAHFGTTLFYYSWQKTNLSDAPLYYYDYYGLRDLGFFFGTIFLVDFVQTLRDLVGGTYLDYFFLFQASGLWAVVFLMRTFQEIYEDLGSEQPSWTYCLLFLPSLHFWTSAIGKDGPLALGSAMAVWASMRVTSRWPALAASFAIMTMFRPHIGLVGVASIAMAVVLDRQTNLRTRIVLIAMTMVGLGAVAATVRSTFSVDVTSAGSVGDFFAGQAQTAQLFDTGSAVLNAPFPLRLLSLLLRPFFIDARGVLGLIASVENLLMAAMFVTFAAKFRLFKACFKQVLFFRYATIFAVLVLLLLAVVYYNVGLGLRQRTMAFPALLALFVAMRALLAQQQRTAEAPSERVAA